MKNLKKVMTLILAVVMVTGLLAGCGSNDTKNDTKESGAPASSAVVQESTEEVAEPEEDLEYVKLKFISVGDPDAKTSEAFLTKVNEMLMEDLNCEIEVQYLTFAEQGTKYPLIVSSGEDYDVIFTASWTNYSTHARNGAYLELTEEMLQKYSPMYYELCKDSLREVEVDGKMYMYMQSDKGQNGSNCFGVRGDLMKEAGIEEITTGAQLEEYLDYVVENHPEMNVIGATSGTGYHQFALAGYLIGDKELKYHNLGNDNYAAGGAGATSKIDGPYIIDTSDPANLKYMDQDVVDNYYLTIYHKLKEMQQKGYWDQDVLSKTGNVQDYYVADAGAAVVGSLGAVDGYVINLNKLNPDADAKMVRLNAGVPEFAPAGNGSGAAINANSKNWERAMMVCDLFHCDPEYVMLLQYGIEGVHYTMNDNGTVHVTEEPEYPWSEPTFRSFLTTVTPLVDNHTEEYFEYLEEYGGQKANTPPLCSMSFDTTNIENEVAAVKKVYQEYSPILNAGIAEDVDAFYAEYKEAMDKAGFQTVLDELLVQAQAYYDTLN